MSFQIKGTEYGNGQRQIHSIKRGYLHNILQYNRGVANYKNKQKNIQKQRQSKYAQVINKNVQLQFERKQIEKRKKRMQQMQILKNQYQNQIKEKQFKKKQQKYMDKNFAINQQQYLNFRNQRRMVELMRIYNRKSYQGILSSSDLDQIDYSNKQKSTRHVRFKTQPLQNYYSQNPQSNYLSLVKGQDKYGGYYKDSLDQLQKLNRQDISLKKYSQQHSQL